MPVAAGRTIDDAGEINAIRQHRLLFSFPQAVDFPELTLVPHAQTEGGGAPELRLKECIYSVPTLRAKWFWYSLMSLLCWTAWALTAKVGSAELPPSEMQFVSGLGFLLVSFAVAVFARTRTTMKPTTSKGKLYSVISGVLLAIGGLASFSAYRLGVNTAATTGITSLYPAITVVCAMVILKEKLNKFQMTGLCLSGIAILLFSF